MCVSVCVCVCVCVCACVSMCMCLCEFIYVCLVYPSKYISLYQSICVCTYTYRYVRFACVFLSILRFLDFGYHLSAFIY